MPDLSPELNLALAVDNDDTADYLDGAEPSLRASLLILDGLFSQSTGHAHNGAHQGGALQFLDLTVGEDLNVVGASDLHGSVHAYANLTVDGIATLNSLDVTTTSRMRGAVTMDAGLTITGTISSTGAVSISQDLTVGRDLSVARNATVTGTLTAATITTGGGNLTVGGVINAGRLTVGYDPGAGWSIAGVKIIAQDFHYQRGSGSIRCWDNADFTFGVPATANTLVQRDGTGYITASYINYAGDVQGGKPTHVLGRTAADTYLRWWPTNSIGPPISAWYTIANMTLPALSSGGGTGNATFSAVANNGGFVVSGTTITVPRPGWYAIAGGYNGSNNTGNSETMNTALIASTTGTLDTLGVPIKISSFFGGYFSWEGFLNQGETIRLQFQTSFDAISGSGEILVSFVPIAQYNN